MTAIPQSDAERARRTEYVRETKAALTQHQTIEERTKHRELSADRWAQWLHARMDSNGCADPVQVLPDALAQLEQIIDDRVAAALAEHKAALRKVLK